MTRPIRPPTPIASFAGLDQRVKDLELALRQRTTPANTSVSSAPSQSDEWVTFNITGAISGASDDYTPVASGHLFYIFNTLKVVGGSDSTVAILKNGVQVATYTIPASVKQVAATPNLDFSVGADYLTLSILSAGTSAQGLVATVRFN